MEGSDPWSGLGTAAISMPVQIWSAFKSAKSSKKASQASLYAQILNQQWQEHMSNTAHQREVADLRAAGLNPILSATGGSGAGFGSVGNASAIPSDFSGVGEGVNSGLTKALETIALKKDIKRTDTQNKNETNMANATVKKTKAEADAIKAGLPAIKTSAKLQATKDRIEQSVLDTPVGAGWQAAAPILGQILPFIANSAGRAAAAREFRPSNITSFYNKGSTSTFYKYGKI